MSERNRPMFLLMVVLTVIPELCDCRPRLCKNRNFYGNFGKYCEETLHTLNCSVGPKKNIIKDTFQCDIRRKTGWDAYQKTLGDLSRCHYEDCEPSQLASLRVVTIKHAEYLDEMHSRPTIQLNFTIPKAVDDRKFYPESTLLQMTSNAADGHRDYKFRGFVRLFYYPKHPALSVDTALQRTLRYPCFIGFQHDPCQSDNYKVYTLTLKSYSNSKTNEGRRTFTELSYNITIYNHYIYAPDKWKSTIAVAFFPGKKDVTVLFDPVPDSVSVLYYNVTLFNVNDDATAYMYRNVGQSTKHCFKDVRDGMYYITIMVISDGRQCEDDCKLTKSHTFTVGNPNGMVTGVSNYDSSSPGYIIEEKVKTTKSDHSNIIVEHIPSGRNPRGQNIPQQRYINVKMISLSVGCGVGVALAVLGVGCCYRWRARKHKKKADLYSVPKVLLVYPHTTPEVCNLASQFAKLCEENLQINIVNDDIESETSISNESKSPNTNWSLWYREKLSRSSSAIIFWIPLHKPKENTDHEGSDKFNTGIKLAVDSKSKNDFKVICVYFDKTHERSIPNAIRSRTRLFHFPAKLSEFCTYLLGHDISRKITISNELNTLICNLCLNTRPMGPPFEYTIPHHDNMSDEETKEENRTLHHVILHEHVISKVEETEDQPLIKCEGLQKITVHTDASIDAVKHLTTSDRETQIHLSFQKSRGAPKYTPFLTPARSVSTSKLVGSEKPQHIEMRQYSRDQSCECSYSSDLSVSRLNFNMMGITSEDNFSQSSGYAHCEPVSTSTELPSCSTPQQYDFDPASDSCGINDDSNDDSDVDSAIFPMISPHAILNYRTNPDIAEYSVSSGSIRSSEIDLTEFT